MKIELKEMTIREVSNGYINDDENGVYGFDGKLNIRPKYQREFVYKDKQRDDVIHTVLKNFPLNVMYWVKNKDGSYEVLDGQQRTISICEYVSSNYSINSMFFHNFEDDEKEEFLNYKLMVYFCEGTDREKLDWFKTINIAGEKLTDQELRNAIFTGTWLNDAKKYFSKNGCAAYDIANNYMSGTPIRQDYLETVISWISNDKIEEYMAINQHNEDANELWVYFQKVISWTKTIFPNYRKEMKGVNFGFLYNEYQNLSVNSNKLEEEIKQLMQDEDVTKKSGIYSYVLSRKEKYLSIRSFTDKQKRETYEKQNHICPACLKEKADKTKYELNEMEADHITPWHEGGKTIVENCQMLCKFHNRKKSGI